MASESGHCIIKREHEKCMDRIMLHSPTDDLELGKFGVSKCRLAFFSFSDRFCKFPKGTSDEGRREQRSTCVLMMTLMVYIVQFTKQM